MKKSLLILLSFIGIIALNAQIDSTPNQAVAQDTILRPPPPPPPRSKEQIFKAVEYMPRFPGCEGLDGTLVEKKQCADKKMLEFIYSNLVYPAKAKQNKIEGTCVVQFTVEKNGKLTDITIVRDIGGGCGAEAARVVHLMNEKNLSWSLTCARCRDVLRQFNLPVKFRL